MCWAIAVIILLLTAFFVFASQGDICINYKGFSVDADGNIYIGKLGRIDVISPGGDLIRTIDTQTNRGYEFMISDCNTIYLNATGSFMILDLEGNLLQEPVAYSELHYKQKPAFHRTKYIAPDGTIYLLRKPFGRPTILRVEKESMTPVYKMPLSDYAVRILLQLVWYSSWIMIPTIIWQFNKHNAAKKSAANQLKPVYSHAQIHEME